MSVYVISDLHLSLGASKPMDVFRGWEHYVDRLSEHWRSIVSPDDTVVLPGDISWAMKLPETRADFLFLHELPGRKWILKGNHDLWWCTMRKMEQHLSDIGANSIGFIHNNCVPAGEYALCGTRGWFFDDTESDKTVLLREVGRLTASIECALKGNLEPIVFLHYPPVTTEAECPEIMDVLRQYGIRRCYYGHIHSAAIKRAFQGLYGGCEFTLVSCDAMNFTPKLVL